MKDEGKHENLWELPSLHRSAGTVDARIRMHDPLTEEQANRIARVPFQLIWGALMFMWSMSVTYVANEAGRAKGGDLYVGIDGSPPVLATVEGQAESAIRDSLRHLPVVALLGVVCSVVLTGIAINVARASSVGLAVLLALVIGGPVGIVFAVLTWTELHTVGLAFWLTAIASATFMASSKWWARAFELVSITAISLIGFFMY